ncbi:MAG: hypothetical protein ACLPSF_05250 [Methylocella sp.]
MENQVCERIVEAGAERAPVLMVRHGRGRTGGTTFADFVIQRARKNGRAVLIGDGDRRNATLAGIYPPGSAGGASQPETDETPDVMDWIRGLVAQMAESRSSLVLDLGAGDQTLAETCRELDLVAFCESVGVRPLSIYTIGPDMEDFDHIVAIHQAAFFAAPSVLVMNHNLVRPGKTAFGAFSAIMGRPECKEVGNRIVAMPRLVYMDQIRRSGLSYYEAATSKRGTGGRSLDPLAQFAAKAWTDRLEREFEENEVAEFLP